MTPRELQKAEAFIEMQNLAKAKGGICLSKEYVTSKKNLQWRCAQGHVWQATPNSIKNTWCPTCADIEWKILSLKDMRKLAESKGGKCLSTDYVNVNSKLLWQCSEGHTWKAVPSTVKLGHWCPSCAGQERGTIEKMRELARSKGGKCLSEVYVNSNTKLLWQCGEGHTWEAVPSSVKAKSWCAKCAGLDKGTIEEMKTLAAAKGGKCLSTEYVNSKTKLRWLCANGHEFLSAPGNIISGGHWCPKCSGLAKGTIEEMHELAKAKGGKCLSLTYINNNTKLLWECVEGHRFKTSPSLVKNGGHWCPKCAGQERGTIEEMQKLAEAKGGKCLSTEYKNSITKLSWQCADGHVWETTPSSIKISNSWCPQCKRNYSYSEERCRFIFESLTGKQFKKTRQPLGGKLEIDGYCKELMVGFEFHGVQHYKHVPHFHRDKSTLKSQQERDLRKQVLCKEKGITLIEIPHKRKEENLPLAKSVYARLVSLKIPLVKKPTEIDFTLFKRNESKLQECQKMAEQKGGKCLSSIYTSNDVKLLWECAERHQWETAPANIKDKDSWCPICAGTQKGNIEEMKALAISRGGKCLSDSYQNNNTKLRWQCAVGHEWEVAPSSIKHANSWCPKCAGLERGTIEEMRTLAISKGGMCLSLTYKNSSSKLLWQCAEGHQWETTPTAIKNNNTWCPKCAGSEKSTIEEMQMLAERRGGKCLSSIYKDMNSKLRWQCAEGHQWTAKPVIIKHKNSWCPKCSGLERGTIEEMKVIATQRGGKCLSTVFVNSKTKLRWQCADGHEWEANSNSIKAMKSWCPTCGKTKRKNSRSLRLALTKN